MTASIKQSKPYLIGVAGGSGSGKTYFARALHARLGSESCEVISQDSFYFDQSKNFDFDGGSVNFDHPDSIDFQLLAKTLTQLKSGMPAEIPVYDFVTHSRKAQTLRVQPKKVIVVDGILILHDKTVRDIFNDRIFFETSEDLRFQRRLDRDVKERGRKAEGVHAQFLKQVKPMHDTYVEPSKAHARIVVSDSSGYDAILDEICSQF